MFLHNYWYVAAWPSEIGETPLARTICGESIAIFRITEGKVVALEDRCCHRNLPLTMGKIEGNNLRCGYHGLLFDKSGQCIEVPGQSQIPPGARVKSYPLVEKWRLLWIWMGDPTKANEALIPNWYYLDHPEWAAAHGNDEKPLYMRCNWELNNDNLLDLSHVLYVHASTLGTGALDRFPVHTERRADSVRMARWAPGVPTPPIFAKYLGFQPNVDRWQISDIDPPAHCTVDVGFAPPGQYGLNTDRSKAMGFRPLITATPETEETSFMFYAQCRNFDIGNTELTKTMIADFRGVFHEDIAVMEAQQRMNSAHGEANKIDINADAPHLAMRQLIRRLAAAEAGGNVRATAAE